MSGGDELKMTAGVHIRRSRYGTTTIAAITPEYARGIVRLMEELNLRPRMAIALYVEAMSSSSSSQSDDDVNEDDYNNDNDMEEGGYGRRVRTLIKVGMAGREEDDNNDDVGMNDNDDDRASSGRHQRAENTHRAALRLHFHERTATLRTIMDLIRHRVEVYDNVVDSRSTATESILIATDQLLDAGLVTNLIKYIELTTTCIDETRLALETMEKDKSGGGESKTPSSPWMMSSSPTPVNAAAAVLPAAAHHHDAGYAALGYYITERQLASECLFYLAYHTQLTVSEVSNLIDLIQKLTNDGLPMIDPWSWDDVVPSPHVAVDEDTTMGGGGSSPWQRHQSSGAYWADFKPTTPLGVAQHPSRLKDVGDWEDELVASLWRAGRPQLLRCVSTLLMTIVCAFDARHVLIERKTHGPNDFGIGNALFPPTNNDNFPVTLLSIHQRLNPDPESAIEEGWKRRDIWGFLLLPYALLLRDHAGGRGEASPVLQGRTGSVVVDVRGTYSQCLAVSSQLKSLTFARLTLIPPLLSSTLTAGERSIKEFYLSAMSELTAQYVDALFTTGNMPISRREWLDEEKNAAQSEWLEWEQRREFGEWAGQRDGGSNVDDEDLAAGPRAVNLMDRPDCLEDIFALVSSVCEANPSGARAFWYVIEEDRGGDASSSTTLAPSRTLQTLDLRQSDNDSSLCVYLTFLASLALADDAIGGPSGVNSGAAIVHSFLSGNRAINPHATGNDRHMHFLWSAIIGFIRFYAEMLSPNDDEGAATAAEKNKKIRLSCKEESSSYYYGAGGVATDSGSYASADGNASSPLSERADRGGPSIAKPTQCELDEEGRNTLMALLTLVTNVASKCHAARIFILGIELPATNDGVGFDGSLEILFSLLTIPSLSSDIMGMTFLAISSLLQPNEDHSGLDVPAVDQNDVLIAGAKRAWELVELCQFIPIKLLSQYSSFAAGGGSLPATQKSMTSSSRINDLPLITFPKSTDYGIIYQFEHVEAKLGQYHATEGFLFLLSTLIKVVGCPPNLGSQWRIRLGCAPYIEYVTDFILPRAVLMDKYVRPLFFASASDECRLVERALEVIEAVIVRYIVPPPSSVALNIDDVKSRYSATVKNATAEMGLAAIASDLFVGPESIDEEGIYNAYGDFCNTCLPTPDAASSWNNATSSSEMLEASFGNQVPLPKTPGFAIMCNLLSTNGGTLLQIIHTILSEKGRTVCIGERTHSRSIAISLFRETPPNLEAVRDSAIVKAQTQHSFYSEKDFHKRMSSLQQTLIRPINPMMLLSYYDKSYNVIDDIGANKSHWAMSNDSVLWRERTILLSLRIICAAAIREELFIECINDVKSKPLSVVPTLHFKGPIHGSMAHRLLHEEKVKVSRLSQLLTMGSLAGQYGGHSLEILPIITEYVGFNACYLSCPLLIAKCAFSVVSYITHTLPHAECVDLFCGKHDSDGTRLARALSRGLIMQSTGYTSSNKTVNLQNAILDLILLNIDIANPRSNNLNVAMLMLGLSGESKENCINVLLDMISDSAFVLDPKTSSTATKCFALIHKTCNLVNIQTLPAKVRCQLTLFMEKLRRSKFWHTQIVKYLGMRGPSTHSILHEISNNYALAYGDDSDNSRRDNDFLHSISYLLKGLVLELNFLMQQRSRGNVVWLNYELTTLLNCLATQPNSLLLTTLISMPLGQSSNSYIKERLQVIEAPSSEALMQSSTTLTSPVDACAGYEIIDTECLLSHESSKDAIEWAKAWNSLVGRVCASSHISQAWSELVEMILICSPLMNDVVNSQPNNFTTTRSIMDLLCIILSRLLSPSHLNVIGHYCSTHPGGAEFISANIEAECALPLSKLVVCLVEALIESTNQMEESEGFHAAAAKLYIAEEDVIRVCALIVGAISSCSDGSSGVSPNDGRASVLSCALTQMLLYAADAEYCIVAQNNPSLLNIHANAVALLFRLSTAPVFDNGDKYRNAKQANDGANACAARSGLLSIFGHMKLFEDIDSVSQLCSMIFSLDEVAASVRKLVHMIIDEDNDASALLQHIALFYDGVELLAKAGVTTKLLEFAKLYLESERSYLASHAGTDGTARLKPPSLLKGHLSLLNGLLASPLEDSDRVALAVESCQLLKIYSGIFERLTQQYPIDFDLTYKFVEAIHSTYEAFEDATGMSTTGRDILLNVDDQLMTLERGVSRITSNLSTSPFPSRILPPLPMELVNMEAKYASEIKLITINSTKESTWWDNIQDVTSDEEGLPMPIPPTGSFSVLTQQNFSSYQQSADAAAWSERKYELAAASAKCLELSLSILICRVKFVSLREVSTFSVDAVAIAKGVCRCSDASRAIQDRLGRFKSHPEEDIVTKLDASHVRNDTSVGISSLSQALELERDYLIQLGTSMGKCTEKMICLALLDAQRMATRSSHTSMHDIRQWEYFSEALTPALDHTEIEMKGVGCAVGGDTEASMAMAQGLRREIDRIRLMLR